LSRLVWRRRLRRAALPPSYTAAPQGSPSVARSLWATPRTRALALAVLVLGPRAAGGKAAGVAVRVVHAVAVVAVVARAAAVAVAALASGRYAPVGATAAPPAAVRPPTALAVARGARRAAVLAASPSAMLAGKAMPLPRW